MIKRLIACLDVIGNNVVKGKKFLIFKKFKNPLSLSKKYSYNFIDEIIYLNINKEKIINFCNKINNISKSINVPLVVGGNIKNFKDVKFLFNNGVDRISLNTTLFKNFKITKKISKHYGKQCIVASIDVKKISNKWKVFINGGKTNTNINLEDWCKYNEKKGIGEFLITSIENDGMKKGYDLEMIKKISKITKVSIIPSGGGGSIKDFKKVLKIKGINSLLLASVLHTNKYSINYIKKKLCNFFFIR
ncbi:HisA/HisF-related TIM barrel protein [Candidatus Vidania fulgoroideorum]